MISDKNMAVQQGAGAAIGMLGGMGVYLGTGNALGLSKLPALGIALLAAAILLVLYRRILIPGGRWQPCLWDTLTIAGLLISAAWLYWGMIRLWEAVMGGVQPFWVYGLMPLALFPLIAYRGEKAALRCAPLILTALVIIAIVDTIFVAARMDTQLLLPAAGREEINFWGNTAGILLSLIVPGFAIIFGGKLAPSGAYGKARIAGILLVAAYMIIELLRDLLLFGDMIALDQYPILRALKSVDFGVGVSRLEFFGIVSLSMAILLGIMLIFSSMCRVTKELIGKRSFWPMLLGTAGLYGLMLSFYYMGEGPVSYAAASLGPLLLIAGSLLSKMAQKRSII